MQAKGVAFRKRAQIAKANRVMFLWVAGVSVIFGVASVGTIFLTQMLFFNERVLQEKDRTIATLKQNNGNIKELESQIRVLDTNQALIDSKAKPEDQAIQVILDALPSDANSLALGASLQNKLLSGVTGLSLVTLQVDQVVGIESLSSDGIVDNSAGSTGEQGQIAFRFSATAETGNEIALKQALKNLESSIRTIDVTSVKIENQGTVLQLTVQARAFYEPARVVELKDKTVK